MRPASQAMQGNRGNLLHIVTKHKFGNLNKVKPGFVCSDKGLTLKMSAKHHVPLATNIPYQTHEIKPEWDWQYSYFFKQFISLSVQTQKEKEKQVWSLWIKHSGMWACEKVQGWATHTQGMCLNLDWSELECKSPGLKQLFHSYWPLS